VADPDNRDIESEFPTSVTEIGGQRHADDFTVIGAACPSAGS
jgi:hypothetical protein